MAGLFGSAYPTSLPGVPAAPMPAATKGKWRGLFGGQASGAADKIAAAGALLAGDPQAVTGYFQNQHNDAAEQAKLAMMAAQRAAEDQTWYQHQEYEAAHPKPVNNDTVNDYGFISQTLGEDAAKQYLRNLGDPIVTVQLPGNRVYSGPRSGMAAALGGGPAPAANLDTVPTVEDGHQYTPGPGGRANQANWKPMGGGVSNGTGTFPDRFNIGGL